MGKVIKLLKREVPYEDVSVPVKATRLLSPKSAHILPFHGNNGSYTENYPVTAGGYGKCEGVAFSNR